MYKCCVWVGGWSFICLVNLKGVGAYQRSMETKHPCQPDTIAAQTRTSRRPLRNHCTQTLRGERELVLLTAVIMTTIEAPKPKHAVFLFFFKIHFIHESNLKNQTRDVNTRHTNLPLFDWKLPAILWPLWSLHLSLFWGIWAGMNGINKCKQTECALSENSDKRVLRTLT